MTNEREPIISNMAVALVLIVFLVFLGFMFTAHKAELNTEIEKARIEANACEGGK